MAENEKKQWTGTVGPRQRTAFMNAWRTLGAVFCKYKDPKQPGMLLAVIEIGAEPSQEEMDAKNEIGERFHWTVDRKNCAEIIKAMKAKTAEREANLPIRTQ